MEANDTLPIKCEGASINDTICAKEEEDVLFQFKLIIALVFIILLAFLGFFIYNLIKCYLPKWRKNAEKAVEIGNSASIPYNGQ